LVTSTLSSLPLSVLDSACITRHWAWRIQRGDAKQKTWVLIYCHANKLDSDKQGGSQSEIML
jgi:hypothetical protein